MLNCKVIKQETNFMTFKRLISNLTLYFIAVVLQYRVDLNLLLASQQLLTYYPDGMHAKGFKKSVISISEHTQGRHLYTGALSPWLH